MLEWITDPNVMSVSDQIEEVNRKMFDKIRSRNDNLVVFFCKSLTFYYLLFISILLHRSLQLESDLISLYVFPLFSVAEKDCKQCSTVLQELENIDDEAEDAGIFFIVETYCYLHKNCISIRMYLHI